MAIDGHTYEAHAVWLMERLLADFPIWGILDAGACAGNGGGESKLQPVQEAAVKAPAGGYDWFQWTGPRRTNLVKFCQARGYDIDSDEGNYQFLKFELEGTEHATLARVAAAKRKPADPGTDDLHAKTVAFEEAFERAGIKNWSGRYDFAKRAVAAYRAKHGDVIVTPAKPPAGPVVIDPAPQPPSAPQPASTPVPEPGSPAAVGRWLAKWGPMMSVAIIAAVALFLVIHGQLGK
jgi:hypothetical protein